MQMANEWKPHKEIQVKITLNCPIVNPEKSLKKGKWRAAVTAKLSKLDFFYIIGKSSTYNLRW